MLRFAVLLMLSTTTVSGAIAKDQSDAKIARPKLFEEVVSCRAIQDSAARLKCYDTQVSLLDEAQRSEEIILTDRAAIKEARKGLFGFNIPKIKIFGSDDANEVKEIEAVIASASFGGSGRWTIELEDGARWQQIETESVNRDPKPGMKAKIRKAALGSYFVNIAGQPAIRMRRIN